MSGRRRDRPVTVAKLEALKAWASEAPPLVVRLTYVNWDDGNRAERDATLADAKADPEAAAWMRQNLRSWLERAPWLQDGW